MKLKKEVSSYAHTIINQNPDITFKDLNGELKNTKSKITYICKEHGELSRSAFYLLEGRGCSKCAYKRAKESRTFTLKDFIEKSNIVHDNKYDYSNSVYSGSLNKISIKCPHHGEFEQLAIDHMTNGHGCRKCGFISTAKKSYLTTLNTDFTTLYYIKCYGNGEVFYKIGVAREGVNARYQNSISMPYLFEILREVRGAAEKILEIEKKIKTDLISYQPLIPFGGSVTECTQDPIDLDQYLIPINC